MTEWILARLKEKSTWRGFAVIVGLFGVTIAPEDLEALGAAMIVIVGIIEMGRKEV